MKTAPLNLKDIGLAAQLHGWITYLERGDAYDTREIIANGDFGFVVKIVDVRGSKLELVAHERVIGYGTTMSACLYMKERTLQDRRRVANGLPPLHNDAETIARLTNS